MSKYRKLGKSVKQALKDLNIKMPFRIGRFIINETQIEGKSVSFETSPSSSIKIEVAEGK